MGCLAMTAATPWPAMTVVSAKHAKMIIARSVSPTVGSVRTLIVLAAWKTVQSVARRRVPHVWLIARIVGIVCAAVV